MKTRVLSTLGAMAFFVATAAQASTPGPYMTGDAGVSLTPSLHFNSASSGTALTNYDAGYQFGGAIGYDLGNGVRLQLDTQHNNQQLSGLNGNNATGHLSSTSLMLNGQVDLIPKSKLTPYVGAGFGGVNFGGQVNGYSGRAWKPGYLLEAGLRDDLTDQISLFGGYRFTQAESVRMSDPTIPDTATHHFSDHAILAGLTYHFGE